MDDADDHLTTASLVASGVLEERADGIRHPSATHAKAFLGLVRAGEALDRGLDADLRRRHGIGLRTYEILLHLAAFSDHGRLPMMRLTQQAPLTQSRVSRLVTEMERQGMVARSASRDDARALDVAITDHGRDRLRQAQDTHHRSLNARFFSRLTDHEVRQLGAITDKIIGPDVPGA